MDNLSLNHTYLLKYYCSDILSSITVLNITNTSYQLRWNQSGNISWEEKKTIHQKYSVVEDISDFVQDVDIKKYYINTKWTLMVMVAFQIWKVLLVLLLVLFVSVLK